MHFVCFQIIFGYNKSWFFVFKPVHSIGLAIITSRIEWTIAIYGVLLSRARTKTTCFCLLNDDDIDNDNDDNQQNYKWMGYVSFGCRLISTVRPLLVEMCETTGNLISTSYKIHSHIIHIHCDDCYCVNSLHHWLTHRIWHPPLKRYTINLLWYIDWEWIWINPIWSAIHDVPKE